MPETLFGIVIPHPDGETRRLIHPSAGEFIPGWNGDGVFTGEDPVNRSYCNGTGSL